MTAEVIPFPCGTFEPVRVEISRATTHYGRFVFFVDYVDEDGARSGMWDGESYTEAVEAAADCARTDGAPLLVVDRVVAETLDAPTILKLALVEEARLTFDDEVAVELAKALDVSAEPPTKH